MIWKWIFWIFFSSLVTCLSVNISHSDYFYRYIWSIQSNLTQRILAGIQDFALKEYEKYFDDIRNMFSPKPLDQYPNLAKFTYVKEHASWVNDRSCLFSSPELKAQVSFSYHLSSVVRLSLCPSVHPSVCL